MQRAPSGMGLQNITWLLTGKQTGQESGGELCGNFQVLIVSADKICKQCLQVQSA